MAVRNRTNKWLLLIMLAALFIAGVGAVAAQDSGSSTDDDNGPEMVSIDATTFEMGESAEAMLAECDLFRTGCEIIWFESAEPVHTVQVDPFSIDLYEVDNESYLEFINELGAIEGACGDEDCLTTADSAVEVDSDGTYIVEEDLLTHPVAGVTWYGAQAYCEWRGDRLPTEAEWELAAGWDFETESKRVYPWGDEFDGNVTNFCDVNCPEQQANNDFDDGYEFTAPVGSYEDGVSPAGLYDMGGNLWEWVADWYGPSYYSDSPEENPTGPESGDNKVVRGGSWFDTGNFTATAVRFPAPADESGDSIGFRCASDDVDETNMISGAVKPAEVEDTEEPTLEATAAATEEPTATATVKPTATATEEPTATATEEPTATATKKPTATPTEEPTATATEEPTATATKKPTATPTEEPTVEPTATAKPTEEPTVTPEPTVEPTATAAPTEEATATEEPTATAEPEATSTKEPVEKTTEEEVESVAPVSFNCDLYPGEDRGSTYVVGACDWLVKIAMKLGVPYHALLADNPQIKNPDIIQMGQVLKVPPRSGQSGPPMIGAPAPSAAPAPPVKPPDAMQPPVVEPLAPPQPPATPSGSTLNS